MQVVEASRRYFAQTLPAGSFHAWVGVAGGRVAACSGLLLHAAPDGRPLYESVGVRPTPTSMEWTPGGE